jgi:membrane peptidoglycan carboxypeptidase
VIRQVVALALAAAVGVASAVVLVVPGALVVAGAGEYRDDTWTRLEPMSERSVIYDDTGGVMATLGKQDRQFVPLRQVPKLLQDAVIAVEDASFWNNAGIDVNAMMRAAMTNLSSGRVEQGGSTITQQLVKNRLLSPKRDVTRKIREVVLALQLADRYPKRRILEQYLNTVYFGQGAYGVQAATERLLLQTGAYGRPVPTPLSNLTIGQAALLAGLISNPEGDNPFVYPERAQKARQRALDRMVAEGVITAEQAMSAAHEPLPTIRPVADLRPRDAWAEEIQDRLINDRRFSKLGATPQKRQERILNGGLRIHATMDPVAQQAAQEAMSTVLPEKPGFTAALVAIKPQTGAVKAMVAGPGFEFSQYNIATSFPGRQAGSTWKAITLAAALEHGFSPDDRVSGTSPCEFGPMGKTQNAEGGGGHMTLRDATVNSVNCAYVRTSLAVGLDDVISVAHRMGIKQTTLTPILTLTLGSIESTPLEMATVGATIADGGIRHDPLFVSKITTRGGKVLFDIDDAVGERAISAETAACATNLMSEAVAHGTGTAARLSNRTAAGKTGTTDEKTDANFLGFTPQLAAFVWHGNINARVPGAGFGGQIPARIFKAFMDRTLAGHPTVPFPPPGPTCEREGKTISELGRTDVPLPPEEPPPETLAPASPGPSPQQQGSSNRQRQPNQNQSSPQPTSPPTAPPTTAPPPTDPPPTSPPTT